MNDLSNVVRLANYIQAGNPEGIRDSWNSGLEKDTMKAVLFMARINNTKMSPETAQCIDEILKEEGSQCL